MKVSDAIARFLYEYGVKYVFGYQGGSVTHLIDSICRCDGIEYIQTYNEQGAALAADAYARVSNEGIGVAIATNGPGATNLVTGVANAYCDSIPVLFLTGQVYTYQMKGTNLVRQESFQEVDIISIVNAITKYRVTVVNKNDVLACLSKAVKIAKTGRPGPVLVDLPIDIQGENIDYDDKFLQLLDASVLELDLRLKNSVKEVCNLLKRSKRPMMLYGGVLQKTGKSLLEKWQKNLKFQVLHRLWGLTELIIRKKVLLVL